MDLHSWTNVLVPIRFPWRLSDARSSRLVIFYIQKWDFDVYKFLVRVQTLSLPEKGEA